MVFHAFSPCRFFRPGPLKVERLLSGLPGLSIEDIHTELTDLYQGCDCHAIPDLADTNPDSMAKALADMVRQIWKDKGMKAGTINHTVTREFSKKLWKGTVEGYGFDIGDVDYETPDHNMLQALQRNVWHFSAAKNYTQLRELSAALLDENGKLRSRKDFYEAAFSINQTHTRNYLRAEYDLAVSGGQMAGKWVEIQKNSETLPLVQFDAVIDSQTTDICRSLDGVTVPVGHHLLKTYYPPNHYGCRLTVRQLSSGAVTPDEHISTPEIPDLFKTNLGESQLIFPKDHPYFTDTPQKVYEAGIKLLPYDQQFNRLNHQGSGILKEHILNSTDLPDTQTVHLIARELAEKDNVDILPRFNRSDDPARSILLPDAKPRKYPDLRINDQLVEVEEVKSSRYNSLRNAIDSGAKQANKVIIKLNEGIPDHDLFRVAKSRLIDHKKLEEIKFRKSDGDYMTFDRSILKSK